MANTTTYVDIFAEAEEIVNNPFLNIETEIKEAEKKEGNSMYSLELKIQQMLNKTKLETSNPFDEVDEYFNN